MVPIYAIEQCPQGFFGLLDKDTELWNT
jgi:hypothetical protein